MKHSKSKQFYYLLTPVFVLLEWWWGFNIRLSLPEDWLFIFYPYLLISFILGGFVLTSKLASALFGLMESSISILLLVLSVMWPILAQAGAQSGQGGLFTLEKLLNFCLVGGYLLYCFYSNPIILGRKI